MNYYPVGREAGSRVYRTSYRSTNVPVQLLLHITYKASYTLQLTAVYSEQSIQ